MASLEYPPPSVWFDRLLLSQSLPIVTIKAGLDYLRQGRVLRAELSEDGRVLEEILLRKDQ